MWNSIRHQLAQVLQQSVHFEQPQRLTDDEIERKYLLPSDAGEFFIKLRSRDQYEKFACEQRDLHRLAQYEQIRVPVPLLCGVANQTAFMLLPFHRLTEGSNEQWFQFGCELACLHQCQEQAMYGWDEDNFLGMTVQPNRWHKHWPQFFAEQRIGWQLSLLEEKDRLDETWNIDEIVDVVMRQLHGHQPPPSLLHGDLWRGNTGFTEEGPLLFDPSCYFGDREADLAMTELFGPFPAPFYQGYQSVWPLEPGYVERRDIYNLYHRLNHLNLFGDCFRQQATLAIAALLAR